MSKILICLALFAGVVAFDYLTGYEVSSYPVYLMPILLAFFYFGRIGGFAATFVATIMWTAIDFANGHSYSHEMIRYWNALSRLCVYGLFVYGLSIYVKTIDVHRRRLDEIRGLIPLCRGCGKILWTDGKWKRVEELSALVDEEGAECPSCSESERLRDGTEFAYREEI